MRWLLAGLAFTIVTTLAIFTVAVKAGNVRYRRQIEDLLAQASVRGIEQDRLVHRRSEAALRLQLVETWKKHQLRMAALVQ